MLAGFVLSFVLTNLAWTPLNAAKLPAESDDFTFVALGDNRPAGAGLPATRVFRDILKEVSYLGPAFVLSSGDLVYGNEETMDQYKAELNEMDGLLGALRMPFFNSPGNHEFNERKELQAEYQRRYGNIYGSFSYGGYKFVAVCTDEAGFDGGLSPVQKSWLTQTLDLAVPTMICMRRPVFGRDGNDEEGKVVRDNESLHKLFVEKKVGTVLEGHDHVYDYQQHDGIEYYISGGAGAPLDAVPPKGGFFHFLLVHVHKGKVKVTVLPAHSIQVFGTGNSVRVANYSDQALTLNDFTVDSAIKPTKATAILDKKGKPTPVDVEIRSVEKTGAGYRTHLRLEVAKHRQVSVTVS